jgi:esterase/lipase
MRKHDASPTLMLCAAPQVSTHRQQLADGLAQLTGKYKQLQADQEAADTELSTLKPAHAELQQMHEKAKTELQNIKTALQKSQEARVHAEVGGCVLWLTMNQHAAHLVMPPQG